MVSMPSSLVYCGLRFWVSTNLDAMMGTGSALLTSHPSFSAFVVHQGSSKLSTSKMSTFILALIRILCDIRYFMVVLVGMVCNEIRKQN